MDSNTLDNQKAKRLQIYSPLIFSLFYFIGPIYTKQSALTLSIIVAAYVVYIVLYHIMVTSEKKHIIAIAIFMSIGIGFTSTWINHSSYAFYWFCAYFASFYFARNTALIIFGCILLTIFLSGKVFQYDHLWFYLPATIPTVGLLSYGFYDKQLHRHAKLQLQAQNEIEQLAKVAERERIARDLHDVMGHSLSTIALKSQLADKLGKMGNINGALKEIAEVATVTSETLTEMRSVISGYKAKSFDEHLEKLIASLRDWHFDVENTMRIPKLSAYEESTLALVFTEAITNILKHSDGNAVTLKTDVSPKEKPSASWALHIIDNGNVGKFGEGHGITGIHERLASIGASLHVSTVNGMHLTLYFQHRKSHD